MSRDGAKTRAVLRRMPYAALMAERDYQDRQARSDPATAPLAALVADVAGDREARQAARDGAPFVASRAKPRNARGRGRALTPNA